MVEPNFDRSPAFWAAYRKGRPAAPDSFFDKIFAYHRQQGGSFSTIHEAGAGPAIHTARLISKFEKVIVSDPSKDNMEKGAQRLDGQQNCEFHAAKLEESQSFIEQGTVDMVVALNMMFFTDMSKAMDAIAFQLKPGGAFVAATFALSCLDDEKAQDVWNRMWQKGAEFMIRAQDRTRYGPAAKHSRVLVAMANDAVPLPEETFCPGAKRVNINWPEQWSWFHCLLPEQFVDEHPVVPSQVGSNDVIEHEWDEEWTFETSLAGLKDMIAVQPFAQEPGLLVDLWDEMATVVGDNTIRGVWPVSLILATRK